MTPTSPADWPKRDAPHGYRATWVVDKEWLPCIPGSQCRFVSGHPLHKCGKPAVASFKRGLQGWYPYCGEHLYGRRFWNNAVWTERVFPLDSELSHP